MNWLKAMSLPSCGEDELSSLEGPHTVLHSGLKNYFYDIDGFSDYIGDWLINNSRQGVRTEIYPCDIGLHLRTGDFKQAEKNSDLANTRLEAEWYNDALENAKRALGIRHPRIRVFTDADDEYVKKIIRENDFSIDKSNNALSAIIGLANSRMIIASRSTFSMWASWLSNGGTIWDKRFDIGKYMPPSNDRHIKL